METVFGEKRFKFDSQSHSFTNLHEEGGVYNLYQPPGGDQNVLCGTLVENVLFLLLQSNYLFR